MPWTRLQESELSLFLLTLHRGKILTYCLAQVLMQETGGDRTVTESVWERWHHCQAHIKQEIPWSQGPQTPGKSMAKKKGYILIYQEKEDNGSATDPGLLHKQNSLFSVEITGKYSIVE